MILQLLMLSAAPHRAPAQKNTTLLSVKIRISDKLKIQNEKKIFFIILCKSNIVLNCM